MISKRDAHRILELYGNPSLDVIEFQFQLLSLRWHPSRNHASPTSIKNFEALCRAYLVLTEGREHKDTRLSPTQMCKVFGTSFGIEEWAALNPFVCSCAACKNNVDWVQDPGSQSLDDAAGASQTFPVQNYVAAANHLLAASQMPKSTTVGAVQTSQKDTNINEGAVGFSSQDEALKKRQPRRKLCKNAAKKETRMSEVFGSAFGIEEWAALRAFVNSCTGYNNNVRQQKNNGSQSSDDSAAASQMPKSTTVGAVQTSRKGTNINEGAVGFSSQDEALLQKLQPQKKLSKKAAKKQRRKQRQMQECQSGGKQNNDKDESGSSNDSEDEKPGAEEEDLDLNSAFVLMSFARKAAKTTGAIPKTHATSAKTREDAAKESRKLAEEGFELCHLSRYKDAIGMFTQALKLCPNDYISYGNRSFCYASLERYDKALYDAEKAVSLQPELPKGYFRRGKALLGLQRYREAAESFKTVLSLDPNCHEARSELHNVHVYELLCMGFNDEQTEWALSVGGEDIQKALDALCGHGTVKADTKMNPGNLEGLCSIWVGNVKPGVTEKMLRNLFQKYGEIQSLRLMSEKFCAFINYSNKLSPSKAMEALQGYELCGSNLLIRFPDNPVIDKNGQYVLLKKSSSRVGEPSQSLQPKGKTATGPGKVKECFYWRTNGCMYGSRCFYQHVPEHKGIDKD